MKAMKLTALALLVAAGALASEEVKSVEAEGEAAIVHGDEVKARDEAKKAALRNAVEQVAGTLVTADTLTKNSQLVSDRVFSNSSGYVKSYSTPACTTDAGVVTCKLTAQVSTAPLSKDLRAVQSLVQSLESKKFVVLIQEQTTTPEGTVTQGGAMTEILTDQLKKDGWTVIDPAFVNGKLHLDAAVGMGASQARELGNLTRADYILYGTAAFVRQTFDEKTAGMLNKAQVFPVSGNYSLTVFAADTGTVLASITGALKFKNGSQGLTKSLISYDRTAQELVKESAPEVLGQFRDAVYKDLGDSRQNGGRLVVEVLGLSDFNVADDFRQVLSERRGVQSVDVNFADGKAHYDVMFVGTSGDLAREFRRVTFQKRKVTVTGKSGNRVELTVAK